MVENWRAEEKKETKKEEQEEIGKENKLSSSELVEEIEK